MKNKFIQISAILFLFFSTLSHSNPINKINFFGLNNTSENTLLALIPFEIGQNFSPYASDQIIEALFKTELFENISIIKNKNSLEISLKENPNIKYFEITLNNDSAFSNWLKGEKIHFTSEALNEQIDENQLSAGNVFTKRKLEDFLLLLESKYSKSGFFNSVITQDIEIDAQNRAGIELSVTQGNRATIGSFGISGSVKIFPEESWFSVICSFNASEVKCIFSPFNQLEKTESELNSISKYFIVGFSFNVMLSDFSFLTILIFSNSPVLNRDSMI